MRKSILDVLHDFASRNENVPSFPSFERMSGGYEFETKMLIKGPEDVRVFLKDLESLSILKTEYRSEEHSVALEENRQIYFIVVENMELPWLKTKTINKPKKTEKLRIPLATRNTKKLKYGDEGYDSLLKRFKLLPSFAHYSKDCFNVFFIFRSDVFSASFSLAYGQGGFNRFEIELEYEGRIGKKACSAEEAESILELLVNEHFPYMIGRLHAETKYESLIKSRQ